jgi:hypothetical protein
MSVPEKIGPVAKVARTVPMMIGNPTLYQSGAGFSRLIL